MSGSIFGKNFQISTWGESHGRALGVIIDGCPSGLLLSKEMIQTDLDRRKPGVSKFTTKRREEDRVEILSGVFEGKTTGTPISLVIQNQDQRSADYSQIASVYRPGHADYTFDKKYGLRDYRGGGRSSGRETAARVAAGAVAKGILRELGISVKAYTYSIGDIAIDYSRFDENERFQNPVVMPDKLAAERVAAYLDECIQQEDSAGGVVECVISGMPAGIGETVFDKLDASLAKAMFSIGAVKGFDIGLGIEAARTKGSHCNDFFTLDKNRKVCKETNHAGGILGGMSDGSPIHMRVYFKPTPSIYKTQKTVNIDSQEMEINIKGRHDPVIVPRAVVVVEAMAAVTAVDLLFQNMAARMDSLKRFYCEK